MQEANKVTCENHGDLEIKFQLKWKEGVKTRESGWTDYYAKSEARSFDLDTFGLPGNADVWIEVMVRAGVKKVGSEHFCYRRECGCEKVYSVSGAMPDYMIC